MSNHKRYFKKLMEFKSDTIRTALLEAFYVYMSSINMQKAITYSATKDMYKPTANKNDPFYGEYNSIQLDKLCVCKQIQKESKLYLFGAKKLEKAVGDQKDSHEEAEPGHNTHIKGQKISSWDGVTSRLAIQIASDAAQDDNAKKEAPTEPEETKNDEDDGTIQSREN